MHDRATAALRVPEGQRARRIEGHGQGLRVRQGPVRHPDGQGLRLDPARGEQSPKVAGIVESQDISPILRERNYYLGPEEISLKPFELFRQALLRTGKVAIARAVLWKKEQLVSISPLNGSLVLTTLMHQDEVKSPPEPPATQPVVISEAELDLALQLIKTLAMEFDLSRYKDRYRDALMQLIQAKVEGKELPAVTKIEAKPTQDLMAALKASLAAAKAN